MAHIKFERGKDNFDVETTVFFGVIDAREKGSRSICAIDEASAIDVTAAIAALLDLVDTITERYPHFRVTAEAARQARDIEKEEGKTDD